MHAVSRLCLIVCLAPIWGCRAAKPPIVSPPLDLSAQLAAAEALLNAGCYDCLREALQSYQQLRTITAAAPASLDRATAGAFRSAALLAARERELGMIDAGHLHTARTLRESWSCAGASLPCQTFDQILDVIQVLPSGYAGRISRPPANDTQMSDAQRLNRSREEWATLLRGAAGQDVLAAYVWLFACTGWKHSPQGKQWPRSNAARSAVPHNQVTTRRVPALGNSWRSAVRGHLSARTREYRQSEADGPTWALSRLCVASCLATVTLALGTSR